MSTLKTKCDHCSRHLFSPNPFRDFVAKHLDAADPAGFSRVIQRYIRTQRAAGFAPGEIGKITMLPCDRCQCATFALEIVDRSQMERAP